MKTTLIDLFCPSHRPACSINWLSAACATDAGNTSDETVEVKSPNPSFAPYRFVYMIINYRDQTIGIGRSAGNATPTDYALRLVGGA